ncbi:cytidylyltransferase domain-containing protein [Diplocloster agilis]|uniref:acylneuraminate cytidylyltransferase family protein n=1 Tax=Diplocloster agilis TaxID=2850323 RepID=UPI0008222E67|nr:acylneuraminate cytidylyltransferase [Suonthocola fibrivorans]MCU6733120.1 acylneuraminate cytidylyltransferase [Suonthocola fibrivorans]SCI76056.1 3-deoxy-manno-octulosonate cytidylyltransferase [uncultured Clostridium sp.]
MKIAAIMPIKLNNERLPGKNTKLLGDKPLLQYELDNLKQTGLLDSISVFCSQERITAFLPDGVEFVKRPDYLDLPTSNFTQIFEEFMSKHDAEIYVYAHATAPFITVSTMIQCIEAVMSGQYDSAFCASKIQDYLWQDGEPMNFDAADIPRSQDLKPIYRETSGIYVFTKEVFEKHRRRIGKKPYIKEVTLKEAVDINNPEDFNLALALLRAEL